MPVKKIVKFFLSLILMTAGFSLLTACHAKEEPPFRSGDDILGIWTDGEGRYIWFHKENRAFNLYVTEQDGTTIGRWQTDIYFYEPGYNLLIYNETGRPQVYQVLELDKERLWWCWADDLMDHYMDGESLGQIIGQVLQNAQQGYEIDPSQSEYFTSMSEDDFLDYIETIGLMLPWDFPTGD